MRYSATSRIGVSKTDLIVTENLGWIFREQPISDVGVDGIIEQVENGDPTGKFMAVQIKTGAGNFYITAKSITLYVSQIHYNYWLNLSIPIILVAHLPEENLTCWQEIKRENFKKSKKKWKIEIQSSQKLNEKSKDRLTKILSQKNDKNFDIFNGITNFDSEFDLLENVRSLSEATNCLYKITSIMNEQTEKTNQLTNKIYSFIELKLNVNSAQVISAWKGFCSSLNITSLRLENEINIFSQIYSQGIFALEKAIKISNNLKIESESLTSQEAGLKSLKQIPNNIETLLHKISELKQSVQSLIASYPGFKESKIQYIEVIDLITFEMAAAKNITDNIIKNLDISQI